MKSFKKIDYFNIRGRGTVYTTKLLSEDEVPSVNEIVKIDNKQFKVLGIERSRILTDPPRLSLLVGLNVTEVIL